MWETIYRALFTPNKELAPYMIIIIPGLVLIVNWLTQKALRQRDRNNVVNRPGQENYRVTYKNKKK